MNERYKLRIMRMVPNPEFEPEKAKEQYRYGSSNVPARFLVAELEAGVLDTEITQAQFEAIRKAVLEQF